MVLNEAIMMSHEATRAIKREPSALVLVLCPRICSMAVWWHSAALLSKENMAIIAQTSNNWPALFLFASQSSCEIFTRIFCRVKYDFAAERLLRMGDILEGFLSY